MSRAAPPASLQLLEFSLETLSASLILGAGQALALQVLTQALAFAVVVSTPLALQSQFLGEALEFPLELQVGVLPR
jgi:hypothetical protein